MPNRPSLDPPPRMKRWLALTVQNERGLNEGEGWWLDGSFIVVVCPEQFAPGDALEIRIDLGGANGSVDTHAVVIEVNTHRTTRGYIHSAQWLAHSQADRDRVLRVVAELKGEPPPASMAGDAVVESVDDPSTFDFPTDPGPVSRPPRARTDDPWSRPPPSRPPPSRPPPSRPPASRPPQARPTRQTPPLRSPPPRRAQPSPTRTTPPSARPDDLDPQLAPGNPPSLYVAVDSVDQLARKLTIIDHQVRLVLPRVKGLDADDDVTIALRMPSGMFIQFNGCVRQVRRRDIVIEGVGVPADTRMVLHELIERAAG